MEVGSQLYAAGLNPGKERQGAGWAAKPVWTVLEKRKFLASTAIRTATFEP